MVQKFYFYTQYFIVNLYKETNVENWLGLTQNRPKLKTKWKAYH